MLFEHKLWSCKKQKLKKTPFMSCNNLWVVIRSHIKQIYKTASKTVLSLFFPYPIFSLNSFILYFMILLPKPSFSREFYQSLNHMLHLRQFSCMVDTGVWGQSCPGCSLYLRMDHGYCNVSARSWEPEQSSTAATLGFAAGQSYGLASQASRNPWSDSWCEDIQVSSPEGAPHLESAEAPPPYICNYWVISKHRLASQVWFLLERGWTTSRSLGSRHHMAHRGAACLQPCPSPGLWQQELLSPTSSCMLPLTATDIHKFFNLKIISRCLGLFLWVWPDRKNIWTSSFQRAWHCSKAGSFKETLAVSKKTR